MTPSRGAVFRDAIADLLDMDRLVGALGVRIDGLQQLPACPELLNEIQLLG